MTITNEKKRNEETVGQRLRRLRMERGLSQRELSGPGVSYAYISRIEGGQRTPSVKAIRTVARKLGVSAGYLETGSFLPGGHRELTLIDAELRLRLSPNDLGAAGEMAQAVLEEATAEGEDFLAVRAEALLGILAARRGDPAPLERLVGRRAVTPVDRPDVFEALAEAHLATAPGHAADLLERALAEVGTDPAGARLATALSRTLSMTPGDGARGEEVTAAVLAEVGGAVDPLVRVRLYWTNARLAATSDNLPEALACARRAAELLRAHEDATALARAFVDLARAAQARGDADAADGHLGTAERLLGPSPGPRDLAVIRIAQAWGAVSRRDDGAATIAREALALAEGGTAEEGEARWVLAEALVIAGDVDAAGGDFENAVALLSGTRRLREATLAARGWGRMLRDAGREDEALDVLEQAATHASGGAPSRAAARR